jgi:hypothetical protein
MCRLTNLVADLRFPTRAQVACLLLHGSPSDKSVTWSIYGTRTPEISGRQIGGLNISEFPISQRSHSITYSLFYFYVHSNF